MDSVHGILMFKFIYTTELIIVWIVKLVHKLVIRQYRKARYCSFDRLTLIKHHTKVYNIDILEIRILPVF